MGNILVLKAPAPISIKNFQRERIIGCGSFGKVWRAHSLITNKPFAIKEINKLTIVKKSAVVLILNERFLLTKLRHPFIVNLNYAFHDRFYLYLVMDLMQGGDLRYHLIRKKRFSEEQTKFFISCIVMGLEYLHINGIIHRDLKPENLIFDKKGYLRITDFGLSHNIDEKCPLNEFGSPGYMSPEVINGESYGIEADYFCLGVIAFECMKGRRPYLGRTRKEVKETFLSKQAQLRRSDVPEGWSLEAADFINKLLRRNPNERLGAKGPQELKNHSWLAGVNWKKILEKTVKSPYKITEEDNFDKKFLSQWDDIGAEEKDGNITAFDIKFQDFTR